MPPFFFLHYTFLGVIFQLKDGENFPLETALSPCRSHRLQPLLNFPRIFQKQALRHPRPILPILNKEERQPIPNRKGQKRLNRRPWFHL